MKIDYSAFIWDPIIDENLSDCNTNVVAMKVNSAIDMIETDVYKKEDLHTYQ